ncbi:uncharacterized protein [Phaseolus vulgaris]|uniref:uncharacterized protein n=1 Tax=Phaseolus vulgaris TaxID=3885 RepID=UPI0035CB3277
MAPLFFDGDNYQMWVVRMETYLEALDLWEAVKEDYEIQSLPENRMVAQIKSQKEKKMTRSKAKACLFVVVSPMVFTKIMSLKSAKAIWDYLKAEYEGDERIRGMQALNLIREFELQRMKESESVKEYSDRLLSIANKVRLLGSVLNDSRIVEKLLVTVPERFEATITTLENTKDLSKISLAELLNALQAQEQRRVMRQDGVVEGALLVKHEGGWRNKAIICRNQSEQQDVDAQIANEEEDVLFVATSFCSNISSASWLIDSGCTNHMTHDKEFFKELRTTDIKRLRIGNGETPCSKRKRHNSYHKL